MSHIFCKKGSALLLVLIFTSLLSLFVLSSWYKSSLFLDLVLQREKFYTHFYLTESLFNYGCTIATKNFEHYVKKPFAMDLSNFIKKVYHNKDANELRATLIIKKLKEKELFISVVLQEGEHDLCTLRGKLFKAYEKSKHKESFVVQNFTIGNFV